MSQRDWTPEEEAVLLEMRANRAKYDTCAVWLDRPYTSIVSKLYRMKGVAARTWGKDWLKKELILVRQWQADGVPGREQARRIGRSYGAWRSGVRRYKLGVNERERYDSDVRAGIIALIEEGVPPKRIAERLKRCRTFVGRVIQDLEKRGLAARKARSGPYWMTEKWHKDKVTRESAARPGASASFSPEGTGTCPG